MLNLVAKVSLACAAFAMIALVSGCESSGSKKTQTRPAGPLPAIEVDYGPGILHRYSGTLFPREAAGFMLRDHKVYDGAGRDFSAIYHFQETRGRIGVIAHVFPTGLKKTNDSAAASSSQLRELVEREIGRSQAQLRRSHPESELLDDGVLVLPIAGGDRTVYRVLYKHQETPIVLSQIYVTLLDENWYLKYRISSWGYEPAETYQRIGPFLSNLPLVKAEPASD